MEQFLKLKKALILNINSYFGRKWPTRTGVKRLQQQRTKLIAKCIGSFPQTIWNECRKQMRSIESVQKLQRPQRAHLLKLADNQQMEFALTKLWPMGRRSNRRCRHGETNGQKQSIPKRAMESS